MMALKSVSFLFVEHTAQINFLFIEFNIEINPDLCEIGTVY